MLSEQMRPSCGKLKTRPQKEKLLINSIGDDKENTHPLSGTQRKLF